MSWSGEPTVDEINPLICKEILRYTRNPFDIQGNLAVQQIRYVTLDCPPKEHAPPRRAPAHVARYPSPLRGQ